MRIGFFLASLSCITVNLLFSDASPIEASQTNHSSPEVCIVGGGIIGALEAYYAYLDGLESGIKVPITVYEKGQSFDKPALSSRSLDSTNTAFNIVPSLTVDEILSVVPRGSELVEKLGVAFSEPGGIRVDDVQGVNESEIAQSFIKAVELYGKDQNHEDRTNTLLMLGRMSMNLWQDLYDHADEELKNIILESNYSPCREPKSSGKSVLHDGYRIDLIYDVPNARNRALEMQSAYQQLGYENCRILSPSEVISIDPSLAVFCQDRSEVNALDQLEWKDNTVGLWRPGGCIDTHIFLPKLYAYLKKTMGTYTDISGEARDYFSLNFNKEVTAVEYEEGDETTIKGLKFIDGSSQENKNATYIFCPGESVGTLDRLGFKEPAYAGFAGTSLVLNIPLSTEQLNAYQNFGQYMELHKVGIVLAWQARTKENQLFIGVGGTKAFYADQMPNKDEAFAKNRNLVQLNIMNDILPEMLSIAYGHETKGKQLTLNDMSFLEDKGVLVRWVGRRAVAYDGFPTLGFLYHNDRKVVNGRCTTHLGSGGVSFGPAAVRASRSCEGNINNELLQKVLRYADSRRYPESL